MDTEGGEQVGAGEGYAAWQLSAALVTAARHDDPAARRRAASRVERWQQVIDGMASGRLAIGSRTPVRGLPAWVTPQVVRGGFATGTAAAGGDLQQYEVRVAEEFGLPLDRSALFAWHLTDAGLARLWALLDGGGYQVTVSEEAALLVVAWLLRAGDQAAALDLLALLEPWAGTLRFLPPPGPDEGQDWSMVSRRTVRQVRGDLTTRSPQPRVAAMNEALTVWNPFTDEVLAHWLETVEEGRIGRRFPDGWFDRATALLDRYELLASTHRLCGKHRNPKENLAILRAALAATVTARAVPADRIGLAQHAVDAMVARRGRPGSAQLTALRDAQARHAALPTHHVLAQLVLHRLARLDPDAGLRSLEPVLAPVDDAEAAAFDVPTGTVLPGSVRQVVQRALAAPVEELMAGGHVPSAEVLAELIPQLAAVTAAAGYRDDPLRTLMARTYRAFRGRRSLLLRNLARQVGVDELPWVQAVAVHRQDGAGVRGDTRAVLVRLGELALAGFPGTILPNPLIRELVALAEGAGLDVPFTEELAADIFMGRFSPKFGRAARVAAGLLGGSVYERYYGLDYAALLDLPDGPGPRRGLLRRRLATGFDDLCVQRAGGLGSGWDVAANGTVIEQAQILTTHNLAALAAGVGVEPAGGWEEPARGAFAKACTLIGQLHHNPRPLRTVKDAAYAWRQLVFFLSLLDDDRLHAFLAGARQDAARRPAYIADRVVVLLAALERAVAGESLAVPSFGEDGPFLGWTTRRHWILDIGGATAVR